MPATKSLQPRAYRASSKMGKKREDGRKGQICECVILAQLNYYLWKGHVNVSKIRIMGLPPRSNWTHFADPWSNDHIIGGFQNCNESWKGMSPVHFELTSLLRGPVHEDWLLKCPYESQIKQHITGGSLIMNLLPFDSKSSLCAPINQFGSISLISMEGDIVINICRILDNESQVRSFYKNPIRD